MLHWEGNKKHEKDHEKRVVLEDIPSDDTMISSLALCEKEQMAVSFYFVDQDEDINATYGFEDEHQYKTPDPVGSKYAGVVSRESV